MAHGASSTQNVVEAVRWIGDAETGYLQLLDQRLLPLQEKYLRYSTSEATAKAIKKMVVRGAPAIGVAAAFGVVLAAQELGNGVTAKAMSCALDELLAARPTAVNLAWAIGRMHKLLGNKQDSGTIKRLFQEATLIREEDIESNIKMGRLGASLIIEGSQVLTYCNTGSLATAGHGTALGVIRSGWAESRIRHVYACETRPYLQGARLTMWELMRDGIDSTLITDNMVGHLMTHRKIDAVFVGADRIAANGDTANKIGTFGVAVLAKYHSIPFYVVAPRSTVDLATATGREIPIEERSVDEVVKIQGVQIAPNNAKARHPAFDVTPAALISAIILDDGIYRADYQENLREIKDNS